jgi:hypothetical protein
MKREIKAAVIAIIACFLVLTANYALSQQQWVRCKSTSSGDIQTFPGRMCPNGWVTVGPG